MAQGTECRTSKNTGHFDHFQFDEVRTERLEQLEERLNDLCQNMEEPSYSLWSDALSSSLTTEDFKDTRMISAVLSILIQTQGLNTQAWDLFEDELFRYQEEGAEWTWLHSQFLKMSRECNAVVENIPQQSACEKNSSEGKLSSKDVLSIVVAIAIGMMINWLIYG